MLETTDRQPVAAKPDMHFAEFVSLLALLMMMTALSLDIMLPALGVMGQDLGLAEDNDRQLIITFYLLGFATGQVIFGPLSDRFGRKPPLYAGFVIFIFGSVLATLAGSAELMFAARVLQGLGSGAPRIIGMAIIRDKFAGRGMSRVMSYIMMVFLITPILAPSFGQFLLQFGSWRLLFIVLFIAALISILWLRLRMSETHAPENRLPLSPQRIGNAIGIAVTTRQTLGYAIGFGFMFGILMSYIGSAEQIFVDAYGVGENFPLYFAAISSSMILAAIINTQLVGTLGMRRLSHGALALILLTNFIMGLNGFPKAPPLWVFCLYMAVIFFCFGLIGPNFNAMAMEKVGQIAGTASSLIGSYA
ncbi:MAG TPA: multidrug effflux MFS transporter, partial [Hyphomicrobiales bacterium]|nr:multidrug effflux MFS transporter [Hyphomicrobiales bacterium]